MAEASVAIDPSNPRHLVAAADPYLRPVRIQVSDSNDGGVSWLPPSTVLPEGFAKSYDPTVAVTPDGRVVVAGGASGVGQTHCQPGSAVFVATVSSGLPRYQLVRDARSDGAYVDRPRLAVGSKNGGPEFVTWTESSGPDASCRGTPLRSTTMFTRSRPDGSFEPARPLPGAGLPAPFGSALAVGDGVLRIAVAEFDPGKLQRVVVYSSRDDGATFTGPVVLGEGPPVPTRIPELGGFVAPLPTVAAGPGHRAAAAWTQADGAGTLQPRVFEAASDGRWRDISPSVPTMELFGTVAYDDSGRLWLLSAALTNGRVEFLLRGHTTQWDSPVTVGGGPAGGYVELGQFLGLDSDGTATTTAVPIDGPTGSALQVTVDQIHGPPAADPTPPNPPPPVLALQRSEPGSHLDGTTELGAGGRRRGRKVIGLPPWAVAVMPVAGYFGARRRRRHAPRRRSHRPAP
jgi:hypothetical protein